MASHPRASREFLRRAARAVRGRSSTLREDLVCYAFDATDIHALPDIVVWPESTADVSAVVRVAAEASVPVVARGAGTGYTGGSVPVSGGLVLSFERMNRILSIDAASAVAVVEPGVVNEDLRARASEHGLTYPPDPASLKVSTLGGNAAEGAAGPRTVLYGRTGDYVVGLEFVLADGRIVRTGYLASGDDSGWDAGSLIVGSEGTLAIVTGIAVRLTRIPELTVTCWAEFPSLVEAARAVSTMTAAGVPVSVLEIIDGETLACSLEYVRGGGQGAASRETGVIAAPGEGDAGRGGLLVELEGEADTVRTAMNEVSRLLEEAGASGVRWAESESERDELWEVRRSISASLARLSTGKINEDITVPRSRIPDFVERMRAIADEVGLRVLTFGHAGDGNLHVNIIVDRADAGEMARARRAVRELFDAALTLGGTLSGEHGIGITKAEHLASELGPVALATTRAVKRALDPGAIMNPEKILSDRPNPWWNGLEEGDNDPEVSERTRGGKSGSEGPASAGGGEGSC